MLNKLGVPSPLFGFLLLGYMISQDIFVKFIRDEFDL